MPVMRHSNMHIFEYQNNQAKMKNNFGKPAKCKGLRVGLSKITFEKNASEILIPGRVFFIIIYHCVEIPFTTWLFYVKITFW